MADGGCTSYQSNTHSTESREVLYPWHPWFGRVVWIYRTRLNHGRMVAHCGLKPLLEGRGVEVPLWMFDIGVCCQMRTAQTPRVSIEGARELVALCALRCRPDGDSPMLQIQHDSLLSGGGADGHSDETPRGDPTSLVSAELQRAALGPSAVGGAATDSAVAGADAAGTKRTQFGFSDDAGGQR